LIQLHGCLHCVAPVTPAYLLRSIDSNASAVSGLRRVEWRETDEPSTAAGVPVILVTSSIDIYGWLTLFPAKYDRCTEETVATVTEERTFNDKSSARLSLSDRSGVILVDEFWSLECWSPGEGRRRASTPVYGQNGDRQA